MLKEEQNHFCSVSQRMPRLKKILKKMELIYKIGRGLIAYAM
jgi:hypothetical protein